MMLWFHPHPIQYYKTIFNQSLITKILEWVLDLFHLVFDYTVKFLLQTFNLCSTLGSMHL
jgi:hypothetical protein